LVVILDSAYIIGARMHAGLSGVDQGAEFCEGHKLDEVTAALVPETAIGRKRLDGGIPKRPAAASVRRMQPAGFWPDSILNERSITGEVDNAYPHYKKAQVEELVSEGWQCLQRDDLVGPSPGQNGRNGWWSITRAGMAASESDDAFERVRVSRSFSKALLHPSIADKAWPAIMRGDLDEAVRASFIAVEVAVREAGKFTAGDIGVDLMRKAFNPDKGPLTRTSDEPAEREGLMHLFSGAILSYKNEVAPVV
jgi:hypothetical protein